MKKEHYIAAAVGILIGIYLNNKIPVVSSLVKKIPGADTSATATS